MCSEDSGLMFGFAIVAFDDSRILQKSKNRPDVMTGDFIFYIRIFFFS